SRRQRSRPRLSSPLVSAEGIDEGLILLGMVARGHRGRLAVRLGYELRRANVRHPDLDGPHALSPQPSAMAADALAYRRSLLLGHLCMLHVTAPSRPKHCT